MYPVEHLTEKGESHLAFVSAENVTAADDLTNVKLVWGGIDKCGSCGGKPKMLRFPSVVAQARNPYWKSRGDQADAAHYAFDEWVRNKGRWRK